MDLQENFTCPICLQLAKDAVESSCCTKIYCSSCIEDIFKKFGHCPYCRSSSVTWHASKIVRKVISQIKIPCQFCQNNVESGMMSNHINKCPKVPITCKLCSAGMTQQEIPKHTAMQHQKEAKQYLVSYVKAIKNQRQSKIQRSSIKQQKPQKNLFKPMLNRSKLMAKLGTVQKYYCGGQLIGRCKCCDGHCGPDNGQNCDACMQLDLKRFNLDKGYFINPEGYICQMLKLFGENRICCFRIMGTKSTGIFSKPVEQTCSVGNCCYACSQIQYSLKLGRYKNMY